MHFYGIVCTTNKHWCSAHWVIFRENLLKNFLFIGRLRDIYLKRPMHVFTEHCRFLVPDNTQKILTEIFDTIFGLKMMTKNVTS